MTYISLAQLKLIILKHGINFSPNSLFTTYPNIHLFKTKYINVHPFSNKQQVFDISSCKDLIPSEVILQASGMQKSIVKLRYNPNSYVHLKMENDQLTICFNNVKLDISISLVRKPELLTENIPRYISDGRSCIGEYISIVGADRIAVLFFDGCYNWLRSTPCGFCDLHPRRKSDQTKIPSINSLHLYKLNVAAWWQATRQNYLTSLRYCLERALDSDEIVPHKHLFFMAGGLETLQDSWMIVCDTLSFLQEYIDFKDIDVIINVPPHDKIDRLFQLKAMGINKVQYNIEVMDETLFQKYCPGKLDFRCYLDKLSEAVSVLGTGNVRSNLVLGLQSIPDTLLGCRQLAQMGVIPDYSIFQPKKHTALANRKPPSIDEVLVFSEELCKIYAENGYTPIFCSLSSRSSIMNELYTEYEERNRNLY